METGAVFDTRRSGRPRTSEENIERVRKPFNILLCSPSVLLPENWNYHVNSAQSPTQEFKIVCLQSANVTGNSAKRHAKTKRICSEYAATNFLSMKHSSNEFVLVMRQIFMSQES